MFDKAPVVTFVSVVNQVMRKSVSIAHPKASYNNWKEKILLSSWPYYGNILDTWESLSASRAN